MTWSCCWWFQNIYRINFRLGTRWKANKLTIRLFYVRKIEMAFETPFVPRGLRWKFCAPGVKFNYKNMERNRSIIFDIFAWNAFCQTQFWCYFFINLRYVKTFSLNFLDFVFLIELKRTENVFQIFKRRSMFVNIL